MRIEQRDGRRERQVLTDFIVDGELLARVAPAWDGECFASPWASLVAGWCVGYHQRYGRAPGRAIEKLFAKWAERHGDQETVKLVESFLASLDHDHSRRKADSSQHRIDAAKEHFDAVRARKLADAIEDDLSKGRTGNALERIKAFGASPLAATNTIDVFADDAAWQRAFKARKVKPLITYDGALGEFFGEALRRDAFIAIMAVEKGRKSFLLQDIAFDGLLQGNRVAIFQCGDMTESQTLWRLGSRIAGRPWNVGHWKLPKRITKRRGQDAATVQWEEKLQKAKLSWKWLAKQRKLAKAENRLLLECHPNGTLSVGRIGEIMTQWKHEDRLPSVITIDYADILAMPKSLEGRDRYDDVWKGLRALSQQFNCLVLTATQAKRDAWAKKLLDREDISEDKRKAAHVTGMIGINTTQEERKMDVLRLNWVVDQRDSPTDGGRCCHVAGSLAIARPLVVSCW